MGEKQKIKSGRRPLGGGQQKGSGCDSRTFDLKQGGRGWNGKKGGGGGGGCGGREGRGQAARVCACVPGVRD
eukprot:359116-Chlamydomonas_euryale.AAC.1